MTRPDPPAGRRVLVVDDSRDSADSLSLLLQQTLAASAAAVRS